jgi:DNA excision repair protein ERCC-3
MPPGQEQQRRQQEQARPLIVQGDGTILLEVESQSYQECRDWLSRFAELVKSPEHIHTYRLTSLAIWNAAASGLKYEEVLSALQKFSRYELPQNVLSDVRDWFSRYGKLRLEKMTAIDMEDENAKVTTTAAAITTTTTTTTTLAPSTRVLALRSDDELLMAEILNNKGIAQFVTRRKDNNTLLVDAGHRGRLKQALTKMGYPVQDLVGYVPGEPLPIARRETLLATARSFVLRKYQLDSADAFYASGSERGGSGVIVLPCGAGKTIVGIEVMSRIGEETLIIGSSTVGVRQWITELLDKTTLTRDVMGEYTGDLKEVKPVTVTTYQCLTYATRKRSEDGGKKNDDDDDDDDDHDDDHHPP